MWPPRRARPYPEPPPRRYDPPHVLWYFGAITAAFAASSTVADVHPSGRGIWQLLVALALLAAFSLAALALLRAGRRTPGGALAAAAVTLVPAVGQGFERLIGVWPDVAGEGTSAFDEFQGALFALGVATILVGLIVFALVGFPFVFVPVAVATLATAALLVPLFVDSPGADDYAKALLLTGAVLLLVALVLDSSARRDEAFWWHVFGLLGIAIGLGWYAIVHDAGWSWVTILVVGAVLLAASAPLARASWATYGVLGVYGAVLDYVDSWLGSWKAAALMVAVSLGLVLLGLVLQLYAQLWARLGPSRPAAAPAAEPPPAEPPPAEPPPAEPPPAEPPPAEPSPPGPAEGDGPENGPPGRAT